MSSMKKGLRRVAAVAVAALVVAPALATAASATPTFAFDRQAGIDRYATSVAVATTYGASTNVILASGVPGHFPDALTASYLAGVKQAPIMLTQLAATPANVLARIAAAGATDVWLIGGTGVISAAQEAALDVTYTVHRLGGLDRYLTSAAVIAEGGTSATTAVLATGVNFPDALAGGPLAYARDMPLAITATNTLPASTLAALKAAGVTSVIALGGPTVISAGVLATLAAQTPSITATRIFGANRSETSSLFATELITNRGFSNTAVNVASGYAAGTGADALGGAPLSGKELRPTLITESVTNVGPGPLKYLTDHNATLASGHIFGGLGAVSQASEDAMEAAARGLIAGSNQTFTVSPAGNQNVQIGTVSQFTFSGITSSTVDIALVGCENVTTAASGLTTFPNSSNPGGTGNVALLTGANAGNDITVVNGVAGNVGSFLNDAAVTGGSVSFTVSNADAVADCYVAVVFDDADDDNNLDLGTNNQPTEAFGVSGDRNVIFPEAGDLTAINASVAFVDLAADLFSTTAATYFYDSGDEFRLVGTPNTALTMAQFEARLSVGDTVTGTYRSDAANQSSFLLNDIAPAAPAGVDAKVPDGTNAGKAGIEVEFGDSGTASVASYNIYRATATQPVITGQAVTCPTIASGSYAKIGSVADKTTGFPYQFVDATATVPPAATSTNPSYCYYVTSVDTTGDEGPASVIDGPQVATAGDTSGAPNFLATGNSFSGATVTVNYDEAINDASTDADASNYDVTVTRGAVTTALTEDSTTDGAGNTVTITVSGIPGGIFQVGDTVVVTAKNGLDGNTVLDLTDVAQPVGDAVQVTTSEDAVAPTATISATAAGDLTSTVQFTEVVTGLTVADFTITGGPTATLAMVDGDTYTLTYATEAVAATDTVTLGANSVIDTAGNTGPPLAVLMTVS